MDHDELKAALSAYRDRELGAEARAQVEKHLGGCPDCRGALGRFDRVAAALLKAPRVEPKEAFVGGVLARIVEEEAEKAASAPGTLWWLSPGFALALGLAVLLWPDAAPSTEALLSLGVESAQAGEGDLLALLSEEEP